MEAITQGRLIRASCSQISNGVNAPTHFNTAAETIVPAVVLLLNAQPVSLLSGSHYCVVDHAPFVFTRPALHRETCSTAGSTRESVSSYVYGRSGGGGQRVHDHRPQKADNKATNENVLDNLQV